MSMLQPPTEKGLPRPPPPPLSPPPLLANRTLIETATNQLPTEPSRHESLSNEVVSKADLLAIVSVSPVGGPGPRATRVSSISHTWAKRCRVAILTLNASADAAEPSIDTDMVELWQMPPHEHVARVSQVVTSNRSVEKTRTTESTLFAPLLLPTPTSHRIKPTKPPGTHPPAHPLSQPILHTLFNSDPRDALRVHQSSRRPNCSLGLLG